jgi:hypothetical protein
MPSVPAASALAQNNRPIRFATGLCGGMLILISLYIVIVWMDPAGRSSFDISMRI